MRSSASRYFDGGMNQKDRTFPVNLFRGEKIHDLFTSVGFILTGLFLGGVFFYLTPLKYINIIQPDVKKIAPADFYNGYKEDPDRYVLVDIRMPEFRIFGYPEMSISMPLYLLVGQVEALPRNKTIAIFCESNLSASAAYHVFKNFGFLDVRIIDGGRTGWQEAELPLVPGNSSLFGTAREIMDLRKQLGAVPG